MGNYNFQSVHGIVGEIDTNNPYVVRSLISTEEMNFGELVGINKSFTEDTQTVILYNNSVDNVIGLTVYEPTHPLGRYANANLISILIKGDIRVKVESGNSWRVGDTAYIRFHGQSSDYGSDYIISPNPLPSSIPCGFFLDGGTSVNEDNFRIHFDASLINSTIYTG